MCARERVYLLEHDNDTVHDGDYELTEYDLADLEAIEDAGY
jgi:hypothetical protein